MNRPALLVLLAALAAAPASADPSPTVAVTTSPARQGSLPRLVTGYGTAIATAETSQTLSVQIAAQITALPVTLNQAVRAGQTLVALTPSPATRSALVQAQGAVALARAQLGRIRHMRAQHLATTDQQDQAAKTLADATAALAALRAQGAGTTKLVLAAPFAGVITALNAAPGTLVAPGTALLQITRLSGATLRVGLTPSQAAILAPGMTARLIPLEAGKPAQGTLTRIAAGLDATTRLISVDITARAPLVPNAAYRADITAATLTGWLIPHAAVLAADDGTFHLFQLDGTTAHEVPVRILTTTATTIAAGQDLVAGGLNPAWPVVVSGATQLQDGAKARPAP